MRKRVFLHMRTAKAQISLASAQSDQNLIYPFAELFSSVEHNEA